MGKNFKYFRIQIGGKPGQSKVGQTGKSTYRHSMYMQSKDHTWISRNISDRDDSPEADGKE